MSRLGWQVLQKFFKERIWICQGQLHGMLLLWTGGAHISSMQYALIVYDLQLILAPMACDPPGSCLAAFPFPVCWSTRGAWPRGVGQWVDREGPSVAHAAMANQTFWPPKT